MAEPGRTKSFVRASAMALLALSLVPVSIKFGWNLLMLPARFPLGWPEEGTKQAVGVAIVAVALICPVSVAVAWWLSLCGVRRGWEWVRSRPIWLRCLALVAPLYSLVSAVGDWLRFQQVRESAVASADAMPAAYWSTLAWTHGLDVALALTLVPALLALRLLPAPREA